MSSKNIYLIGPMGSGKSTIGIRLAKTLGSAFFDTDREIEARTGASVNLIFDIEGEAGFREREHNMLKALSDKKGILVATGGGIILNEENRQLLKNTGLVIYLKTSIQQQLQRLRRDKTRPILQNRNKEDKLIELAAFRNPLYEQTAHLVFPAKNRNIDNTVSLIAAAIENYHRCETESGHEPKPHG